MKYIPAKELELLNKTGRISTHPHIHCSKCGGKTTAFGSNLKGKMEKAGGLGALLVTFECRSCRTAGQNKVRLPKAPREKRVSKRSVKLEKTAEMLKSLPKMQFAERKAVVLVSNPEFAAEVTQHSCVRPDIFLDSAKSCDYCTLYGVCKAPNRCLSKQGWQMEAAAKYPYTKMLDKA